MKFISTTGQHPNTSFNPTVRLFQDLKDHISGYELPVPSGAINVEAIHSNTNDTVFSGPQCPEPTSFMYLSDTDALQRVSGSDNAVMPSQWPQCHSNEAGQG